MRTRLKIFSIILILFCGFCAASLNLTSNNVQADESSPVQLYIGSTDNIVPSGTVTNQKFGVIVKETGYVYVRFPNNQTEARYVGTSLLFSYTQNGIYTIYRYSPASSPGQINNLDEQIIFDNKGPVINIYENNIAVDNNFCGKNNITATVSDNLSGVSTFEVSKSGASFVPYGGETLTDDGIYEFRATDIAGNESRVTVTKDNIKPAITAYVNNNALANNALTNAASIEFKATDALAGIQAIEVKLPNSEVFTEYTQSGIQFTESGKYEAYAVDKSGNVSDTVTITVDNIVPVVTITSSGATLIDNCFININSIKFNISETAVGYVRKTSNGATETIENGATFTIEDTYTFWAVDAAGNISTETTVTIDRTAPYGNFYADGQLTTAQFTNAAELHYTATDKNGFVVYVKKPNESAFTIVANSFVFTAEGTYSYYIEDAAGNQSAAQTITIDRIKPQLSLFANTTQVNSGDYVNAEYISVKTTDDVSGVKTIHVKTPGSSAFESYNPDTKFYAEGTYQIFCEDNAGNTSSTQTVTLDRSAPIGTLYSGGTVISNDGFTNAEFSYKVTDNLGISRIEIKKPGGNWESYTNETTITGVDGAYYFRAYDFALNVSLESKITLDTVIPTLQVLSEGIAKESGAYIAASTLQFYAFDTNLDTCYIKLPQESEFRTIFSGTAYTNEGTYYFYAVDKANNQSETFVITIDKTAPIGTISVDGTAVDTNSYTNQPFSYSAVDTSSGIARLEVKKPSGNWETYTGGTNLSGTDGTYYFRALDNVGNTSAESCIIYDNTKPQVEIFAAQIAKESGEFTNAEFIKFVAADNNLLACYIKLPNKADFETTESGLQFVNVGRYEFYAVDKATNRSNTYIITIDRTAPIGTLYVDGVTVQSGSFTKKSFAYNATDDVSGIARLEVKKPSGDWVTYTTGANIIDTDGEYSFRAIDFAGNISTISIITLDRAKPSGKLYIGGNAVNSGAFTNRAFSYVSSGGLSGIDYCEIKKPNGTWERYTSGDTISAESQNGKYVFRCINTVGTLSDEVEINLDTVAPIGKLYANGVLVTSGIFSNAPNIKFVCDDGGLDACFVKLPNTDSYVSIASNTLFEASGRYEFYALDTAGNASAVYYIIIDRTPKSINTSNVIDGKTTQNVTLSWQNLSGQAPIVSVTVNGIGIENNTSIATINGGIYEIISCDEANNIWTSVFTANRTDIETTTSNKFWWEAKSNNQIYSFASYESALEFATQRENALVKTLTWNSATWDTGYIMDQVDSVNAAKGTFYVYKKHDNPSIEVAYFTLNRLEQVISKYAEQDITKYYYWEKKPAESYPSEDVFKPFNDGVIIATSVSLRSGLSYKVDGVLTTVTTYSTVGKHTLTIFDDYYNTKTYELSIVSAAPNLEFKQSGSYYTATNSQPYYLSNSITVKVVDDIDEFALLVVKNSKGEIIRYVNFGEEFNITEPSKYTIKTVNHFGSQEYTFYISYNPPVITAIDNKTSKRLEVNVAPSSDSGINLLSVQIFKQTSDNNWSLLTVDDYGLEISLNNLKYSFYKTGKYKVVVEDICRNGIDAITYEVNYEKPIPIGTLIGVNEHGYSNNSVSFVWTDEAYANLFIDGLEIEYVSGTVLTDEGTYKLIFRDLNGYSKEYNFVIDKTAAEPILAEAVNNGYSKENAVTWDKDDVRAMLYFNGVPIGEYEKASALTENGHYEIVLTDLANNVSVVSFAIDTVAPTAELVGVSSGGKTKGNVKLVNPSKDVQITCYLDGQKIDYAFGDTLSAVGKYTIVLTDAANNITEYTFEINYSVNAAGTIFIVILITALIGGTLFFLIKKQIIKLPQRVRI